MVYSSMMLTDKKVQPKRKALLVELTYNIGANELMYVNDESSTNTWRYN